MNRAWVLLLSLLASSCLAEPIEYEISQGGSKIGSNIFESKDDGSFSSTTRIEVMGVRIESDLTGQFADGLITTFSLNQKQPGVDLKVTYANGKAEVTVNGKVQPSASTKFGKRVYSNYHPGIMSGLFQSLPQNVQGPQKVKVAILDSGGAEIETMVEAKAPRKIQTPFGEQVIRFYVLQLGGVHIELGVRPDGMLVAESVVTQKVTFIAKGYESAVVDPIAKYKELSQPTFQSAVEKGGKMAMRDGVTLVHDLAKPILGGRYPTILVRTPYGREGNMLGAEWWAKRGYVYLVQDCRGRGDSDGEWDPFVSERADGKDTIDWIAKQPWSDGKVGMIGGSYSGLVQWAAAVELPTALKCIVPQVSPPDAMRNIPYDHGVFMLLPNLWWSRIVMDKSAKMDTASQPLPHPEKLLTLPLSKVDDAVLGKNVPFFDEWLKRDGLAKWKGFDFVSALPKVSIPALHISGWWDGDGIGTKTNRATLRDAGRKNQWLIYGPWPHAFNTSQTFGDLDYGPSSVLELDSVYLRWFDTWLKGKQVDWIRTPKVQVFVTGANKWAKLKDWPERPGRQETLFLSSGETLSHLSSKGGKPAQYVYDPRKVKLPDLKNRNLMAGGSTIVNLYETKGDHLKYFSKPMTASMIIAGPISLELYFSTNVVATDFFAYLVDIDPNGVARIICQPGKLDVRYLAGLDKPRLIKPGKTYKATIGIWDTAHEFKKGHRLGLLVNSQMFPAFARNLNTGEPAYSATKIKVANQTVFQDAKRPSALKFRLINLK